VTTRHNEDQITQSEHKQPLNALHGKVYSTAEPDRAVTAKEAAAYIGVAPGTLANWRVKGRGPHIKLSAGKRGVVRYLRSELDTWLFQGKRRSTSDVAGAASKTTSLRP
jgi:hypothetical protein